MMKHILIIQGHPDPAGSHFGHALAEAYETGARHAGHEVRRTTVATLDFPVLRTKEDFESGSPSPEIAQAQQDISWADHLVFIYPLWLGTMPALLKAFLEQVFREDFATKRVKGKSARIVITMGMPAFLYRWYFGAHSLKSLERNVLGFCGIKPIRESLVGAVESKGDTGRKKWLEKMAALGAAGR